MKIRIVQDSAARFLKENSATVLTAGGVVGVVGTAVLTARAAIKADRSIQTVKAKRAAHARASEGEVKFDSFHLDTLEKVRIIAPHCVLPVIAGGATIGSILLAHRLSAAKIAALAAAYGVSQSQLEEYKSKLEEKLSPNQYEKARAEMAQEKVDNTPGGSAIVIYGDEVKCFDRPTGRYFKSTVEKLNQAANACNREIMNNGYAPASMFYDLLDLPNTTWANDVGWNELFELEIDAVVSDGSPCITTNFKHFPVLDYQRGGHDRYS